MVYSVSEITGRIKELLETAFTLVTVEGEISNCRPSSTGHLYFTLKEKTTSGESAISTVMFKSSFGRLNFKPEDGLRVQVTGNLSVYAARGSYQIIAASMKIAGEGEILQMLEERKKKLAAEGLFSRPKKPLPSFVTEIAVITSPTGAAVRDIIKVARKRNPKIRINLLPAVVQGEKAAESLIAQLKIANKYKLGQLIIIGRGGGSLEDLLPFSDEELAREIARSELPVISAVGHEIDTGISDFVADVRAATPSEASELAVPLLSDLVLDINQYRQEIAHDMVSRIERITLMMQGLSKENLRLRFRNIKNAFLLRLDDCKMSLQTSMQDILMQKKHRLEIYKQKLVLSNPQTILNRGFAVVKKSDGSVVREASTLTENEVLRIQVAKGQFAAKVTEARTPFNGF